MMRYLFVSLLLSSGCVFRVNPDYVDATPDQTPSPEDAAARPSSSAPPADLGMPASPPPPDQAPSCTSVSEGFHADPSARWALMGNTAFDSDRSQLSLTALGFNRAGSAFHDVPLTATSFDARFTFVISDGSGADGLAFVLARAASAGDLAPYGDGLINQGWGLGYLGMDGFAVEFDTFKDLGNGDPNDNHVALVRTSDGTHLMTGTPSGTLHSTGSHTAHVRVAANHVTVEVDGTKTIDADLPTSLGWPTDPVYFGFTGASGTFNDRHAVSDFTLVVGPSACF
jgi:hypothetical protein